VNIANTVGGLSTVNTASTANTVNVSKAFRWLAERSHYAGANGIDNRTLQHLQISLLVLIVASLIALPIGLFIGHTGRGRGVVALAGAVRALPTLGLITLIALSVGIGLRAPMVALVVLAVPSILAGAYAGLQSIDRATIDAARALGMSETQILRKVELPLGRALLIGGVRSASLQVIATATLADYVGGGGLGRFIFLGLKTNDYPQMLSGSLLVVALAVLSEAAFSLLQHLTQVRRSGSPAHLPPKRNSL
jgi:osmoprotectant transport system permease protein